MRKVPAGNMAWLKEKLDSLNRRAAKLECAPIVLTVVGEEMVQVKGGSLDPDAGPAQWVRFLHVEVSGQAPTLNGWTFIARLQHEAAGTIICAAPGVTVPEIYRTARPICEHCHTNRPRRDTFLVRNDAGEYRQVGRQCLADFLDHHGDPDGYVAFAAALGKLETLFEEAGDERNGAYAQRGFELAAYLPYVAAEIREYGWRSRQMAEERGGTATCMTAWTRMCDRSADAPTETDTTLAHDALAWAATLENQENDYLHNVAVVAKGGYVDHRNMGLAASIIPAHRKHQDRVNDCVVGAASQFVGEIGQRMDLTLTVTGNRYLATTFGTFLIHLEDVDHNRFVWFASVGPGEALEEGKTYRLRVTVKAHQERDGVRETAITRCKVCAE